MTQDQRLRPTIDAGTPADGPARRPRFGPGALVAAAFIGPGTVTTCTLAGASFGFSLVWALAFATVATIVLQDMSARLGVGARLGLGEALARFGSSPARRIAATSLILVALGVGNAAYEAGNLAGGALGLEAIAGDASPGRKVVVVALAAIAGAALLHGEYKLLERLLLTLVACMALAFAASAAIVRPDLGAFAAGLAPRIPDGGLITAIALIGTTIVPYNLFLHAAAARRKWRSSDDVAAARLDSATAIGLGGVVSILILSTAATSLYQSGVAVGGAGDMALAIEPTFGPAARYVIGAGLAAAGLTSAITAPMATGFVAAELFGGGDGRARLLFRATALATLLVGTFVALLDLRPVSLILVAQYANGLLLPVVAGFLVFAMNDRQRLGDWANGPLANIAGAAVVLVAFGLGARSVLRAMGLAP
ncbi:MAG: divalent metal cation transporter [Alphaproteobacteria bacterium]|nr:divalent metal cation transporter [Alphaproteobacteria bacterium]